MRRQFYTSFAGIEIPPANRKEDIGSHEAKSGIIETCGGYIDGYTEYAPINVKEVSVEFDLVSDNKITLDEKIEEWKSLVAKKDKLYRRVGDRLQWAYSRLMSLEAKTDYEKHWGICNIMLNFEIISPYWNGNTLEEWSLDTGMHWDQGLEYDQGNDFGYFSIDAEDPRNINIVNRGNISSGDMILKFSPQAQSPAGLTYTGYDNSWNIVWQWSINTDIPAVAEVTIDSGRKIAYYISNGVKTNLYKNVVTSAAHNSLSWIEMLPGLNRIVISTPSETGLTLHMTADLTDKWR